jgi:alpha-beta hydrolase superfamily lysophospholipase
MQHDLLPFQSADGLTLHGRVWRPDFGAKGLVLIVHGLGEHSGRYAGLAGRLMVAGYAVYAYDHLGHGESPGERGMIDRFGRFADDLAAVIPAVRADAASRVGERRPLFLFGQSMGGLIAAEYVHEQGADGLAGLLLSAPALRLPDDTSPLLRKVAPLVNRFLPKAYATKLDVGELSRDPVVGRAYTEDPLTEPRVRVRLGYELLRASERIRQTDASAFTLPLYLVHGEADPITDPDGSRWLYDHAPSDDKTLRLLPDVLHEPHNDPDKEAIVDDLISWLDQHV